MSTNSGLTRVRLSTNNNFIGFRHRINDVLQGKCHVFIARGEFMNSDVPTSIPALSSLYSGTNCPFLPLGDMDATGSNITWSEKTIDTDFSTIGAGYEITGTFVSITINRNMFQFITDLGHHRYSFLFVPEGTNDVLFAVSGVTITTEGNMGVVEDGLSKITFKVGRKANKVTDVIKFRKFASPNNTETDTDNDGTQQDEL